MYVSLAGLWLEEDKNIRYPESIMLSGNILYLIMKENIDNEKKHNTLW